MNTDYKSNGNSHQASAIASTSPVMLALSTFKHADIAIDTALEKASRCQKLVIVYGHDVNLGLYFMESGVGLYPDLKEQCEKEILTDYEQQWKEKVEVIADRARAQGIEVVTYVRAERFTSLCLKVIEKEEPSLIVTAMDPRSPSWLRGLFGSAAGRLAYHTDSTVINAYPGK